MTLPILDETVDLVDGSVGAVQSGVGATADVVNGSVGFLADETTELAYHSGRLTTDPLFSFFGLMGPEGESGPLGSGGQQQTQQPSQQSQSDNVSLVLIYGGVGLALMFFIMNQGD